MLEEATAGSKNSKIKAPISNFKPKTPKKELSNRPHRLPEYYQLYEPSKNMLEAQSSICWQVPLK